MDHMNDEADDKTRTRIRTSSEEDWFMDGVNDEDHEDYNENENEREKGTGTK